MKATKTTRKLARLMTLVLASLALSSPAWAANYTITDLGTFCGTISGAYGINNNGQVVGSGPIAGDAA